MRISFALLAGMALAAAGSHLPLQNAFGQVQLVDDIILLSQGQRQQERARADNHLGESGGVAPYTLGPSPGSGETAWRGRSGKSTLHSSLAMPARDVLSAASVNARPQQSSGSRLAQLPISLPPTQSLPVYGPLEVPALDEVGPAGGLTLDAAIERLTTSNYELRAKFREIPKAQADLLSAGLRNNPLIFAAVDGAPYGSYSPARPGNTNYSATVIQPFDLNHKRRARVAVAASARQVLQAQYQDAVRLEIDALYTAYVDVLAAREAIRFAEAGIAGLDAVVATTRRLVEGQEEAATEFERLSAQREAASIALEQARCAGPTILGVA